jgi:hypothetical protein
MNTDWAREMFIVSCVGSLAGLFWPILIALWKRGSASIYRWIGPESHTHLGGDPPTPSAVRYVFIEYIFPILGFFLVAVISAVIAAAVGFGVFLQDERVRNTLQELGFLGYFSAFTYGFSASSLVEEAMKK